jgi:hypothetical protein
MIVYVFVQHQDGLIDYKIHGPERQVIDGDFDSHGNTITSYVVSHSLQRTHYISVCALH